MKIFELNGGGGNSWRFFFKNIEKENTMKKSEDKSLLSYIEKKMFSVTIYYVYTLRGIYAPENGETQQSTRDLKKEFCFCCFLFVSFLFSFVLTNSSYVFPVFFVVVVAWCSTFLLTFPGVPFMFVVCPCCGSTLSD